MRPRAILLSGACGSGKTSVLQAGHVRLAATFGRIAGLDTDWLYMFVDPKWELPYERWRTELALRQCGLLATSFFDAGFDTVIIAGNALHTPKELDVLLVEILERADVFHVTLDPSLDTITARVAARGGDKTPEWLRTHVSWMREKYEAWTALVDNSDLTVDGTISEIARRVERGEGRLVTPFGG